MSQSSYTDRIWALDLTPNLKLVLLALARAADDAGYCDERAAQTYLQQTGYSVNQLGRLLSRLIELGYLVAVEWYEALAVRRLRYRLCVPEHDGGRPQGGAQ